MTQEDWNGMAPDTDNALTQRHWNECQNDIEDIIDVSMRCGDWDSRSGARTIIGHLRSLGYSIKAPEDFI